jgi:hypothetical protein
LTVQYRALLCVHRSPADRSLFGKSTLKPHGLSLPPPNGAHGLHRAGFTLTTEPHMEATFALQVVIALAIVPFAIAALFVD